MSYQMTNETWKVIKEKIKKRWSKLTEEEIETLKEDMDHVVGMLQTVYCCAKQKAEMEYKDFKRSIKNLTNEVTHKKPSYAVVALSIVSVASLIGFAGMKIFQGYHLGEKLKT